MIRNIVKKIIGRGSASYDASYDIPKKDTQAEIARIDSDMAVYVNKIKLGKALIDQIDAFPDGTFLVISEEDNQRLADQRDYERYDGWQKESLSRFVKSQYSDSQRRLREMRKKHKELKEMYDAPE